MIVEPDVIVVGGGPAGMMTGLLLARAGVETLVLEKHADFFRDFRGDTVHPSTMEVLSELGMLERFLERPHDRLDNVALCWNGRILRVADFSRLHTPAPFIALMPQWDFLDFLRREAADLPCFRLRMEAQVAGLVEGEGRIKGVKLAGGETIVARKLVIFADGRESIVRRRGVLPLIELGAPIDVLWFSVPKAEHGDRLLGAIDGDRMMVLIDRTSYWQCAYVIAKGGAEMLRGRGIAAFRESLTSIAPQLKGLEDALPDWEAVRTLNVSLDRLARWHRPGLLAIGDAAHAMSPIGGVGINLAIQDAVCTANVLAQSLRSECNADPQLHRIAARRVLPTRLIQRAQQFAHERLLEPVISGQSIGKIAPWPIRLLDRYPALRKIPGRLIGMGIRREHVRSPAD